MEDKLYIILGGRGLIGSAVCSYLQQKDKRVISVHSQNYTQFINTKADVLINCNGSPYRFKAEQNPKWDFEANVLSVQKSLFDFDVGLYIYLSTVDVYNYLNDPLKNKESSFIEASNLNVYGFHKWLAERLVEKYAKRSLILRLGTVIGPGLKKGPVFDLINQKPLYMSLDSQLSLVHTHTISEITLALSEIDSSKEIFNVTGEGWIRLRDISSKIQSKMCQISTVLDEKTYRYDINNSKLYSIFPIPSSPEALLKFVNTDL